jgi:phosphotransferase system, enzyme I, PtsP
MRPASVGPVKHLLRRSNLIEVRQVIEDARARGEMSAREPVMELLRNQS